MHKAATGLSSKMYDIWANISQSIRGIREVVALEKS